MPNYPVDHRKIPINKVKIIPMTIFVMGQATEVPWFVEIKKAHFFQAGMTMISDLLLTRRSKGLWMKLETPTEPRVVEN